MEVSWMSFDTHTHRTTIVPPQDRRYNLVGCPRKSGTNVSTRPRQGYQDGFLSLATNDSTVSSVGQDANSLERSFIWNPMTVTDSGEEDQHRDTAVLWLWGSKTIRRDTW